MSDLNENSLNTQFEEITNEIKSKVAEMRTENEKGRESLALKISEEISKTEKMQKELSDAIAELNRKSSAKAVKKEVYRDSLNNFIRKKNSTSCVWDSHEVKAETGTVTNNAYGGFTVVNELDNQIQRSLLDNNVVYGAVSVRTVSTPNFEMPVRVAGVATEWLDSETASITQQDAPQFKRISPKWGNLASRADLSIQLIEDSQFDVVSYLMDEFGIAFADAIENVLTTGDGTNKPIGLLHATLATNQDKTRAVGTYQKLASGTANVINTDDLIKLFCSAKNGYRMNGSFMMNSNTELAIRLLTDKDGKYIWQPSIAVDRPSTILNRPLLLNEYMPDVATGQLPIIFGDFRRGFCVVERTGMHIKQDDITGDLVVKYKCFKRYGSLFTDSCALKYLEIS